MQRMINHCGTAGLGTLEGDGGMLELAYSVVTTPGTQYQIHTPNKLTRDKAL